MAPKGDTVKPILGRMRLKFTVFCAGGTYRLLTTAGAAPNTCGRVTVPLAPTAEVGLALVQVGKPTLEVPVTWR